MDANKLLKSINNLNGYIRVSNDVAHNYNNVKIQFNMSTLLALKKIRSLEIEYFNKYEENGAAIHIFELILRLPLSKSWDLLGRELISLLQYWLDAMRKHLIFHNNNWWSFLEILLKFIKEIGIKDIKMNNVLLEETGECLLDLATHSKPDIIQRHEILCLFNLCGADSSREIRFALRKQLDSYFTKLSAILPSCGDVAVQYSILEALLRWLLPRQDKTVRSEAANKWFPEHQFAKEVVEVFLQSQWFDFFQDARDFLNAHNTNGDLITSVVCKRLSVGGKVVIGNDGSRIHWLDMSLTTGRLSITLEPKDLEKLSGELTSCCGSLVLTEALSIEVKFCREGSEVTISVVNSRPPQIVPSLIAVMVNDHRVKITISPDSDVAKVDRTLRSIYGKKYQVLFDVANIVPVSKLDGCSRTGDDNTEQEQKFSHTIEPTKRRHAGYIVNPKRSGALASPSTASTSSLAQLHDKLAALPRYNYEKEPAGVCARPQLSNVTELSEEDRQSLNTSVSTIKLRPYGVCHKGAFTKTQVDAKRKQNESKCLSPAVADENSVSCLLVATIGSADESVINDTLERFPQNKDNADNIIDLLVLEAFQSEHANKKVEGTNQESKKTFNKSDLKQTNDTSKGFKGRACTVISNSSHTEESNAEFVEETQFTNVNFDRRKKGKILPLKRNAQQAFDEKAVEEFFSQHFAENRNGDLVISPTLVKKINETSSETSEEFDADELNFQTRKLILEDQNKFIEQTVPNLHEIRSIKQNDVNFDECERVVPDLEVIECVNFILDRICLDFTTCKEILPNIDEKKANFKENSQKTTVKSPKETNIKPKSAKVTNKKTTKGVKLNFNSNKNTRITRQRNKLKLAEPTEDIYKIDEAHESSMPCNENIPTTRQKNNLEITEESKDIHEIMKVQNRTTTHARDKKVNKNIMQKVDEVQDRITPNITNNKHGDKINTPIARRKRKLYSPKDEKCNEKYNNNEDITYNDEKSVVSEDIASDTVSEFKTYEKKKQITYYKQIEEDRKNYRKKLRNQKLKSKEMEMSPKTKRLNEAFDNLKKGVETNEQIILADKTNINDIAVYNFTSESEDEDFKKKTSKPKTNTIKVEEKESKKKLQPKGKRVNRLKSKIKMKKLSVNLGDERMREATVDILNTSMELRKSSESKHAAEIPILTVEHVMEPIKEIPKENIESRKTIKKQKKTDKNLSLKGKPKMPALNETADRTVSPLPGLLVEATHDRPHDSMLNDMVTAKMMQKFQEIYERKSVHESEHDSTRNLLDNNSKNLLNITETSDMGHAKIDDIPMEYLNTSKPSSAKDQSSPVQKQKRKRKKSSDSVNDRTKTNKSLRVSKDNDGTDTDKNIIKSEERSATQTNKSLRVLNKRNKTDPKKYKTTVQTNITPSFTHKKEIDSEVISISGEYSEKSFDTVGHSPITAHGDLNLCENDLPPSKDSLKRNLEPRNLEVEDLDQSIKEFFTELNKDIAEGTFGVRNLKSSTSDSSDAKKSNKTDDIRARSKFKDYNNESNEENHITNMRSNSVILLSNINDDDGVSDKSSVARLKSPLVSVTRLSSAEINKWMQSRPNSEYDRTPTKELDRVKIDKKNCTDKKKDESKSKGKIKMADKNEATKISKSDKKGRFTSSISPIKLFDELKPLTRRDSHSSISAESEESQRNVFNNKVISPVASTQNTKEDNYCELKSSFNSNVLLKSFDDKIPSLQISDDKRRIVENFGSQRMDSDPSTSSVTDWFRRIAPKMSQEEAMTAGFKDNLSSIMEKLDTTLVEIHHDTSKRLAGMFAEAQAKLVQVKRERKLLYQKTASELLSGVLKLVDQHFEEMDKRSQEMDEKFMAELKEKSRNLIREDCAKKKAMVRLLSEDVQAVVDLNFKGKKPKTK